MRRSQSTALPGIAPKHRLRMLEQVARSRTKLVAEEQGEGAPELRLERLQLLGRDACAPGNVQRRDRGLAAAGHGGQPRGDHRAHPDRAVGVEGRLPRPLLHGAVIRLPPEAKVEGLRIGGVWPQCGHGLAGPMLFAEIVAVTEKPPRRAHQMLESPHGRVEIGGIAA